LFRLVAPRLRAPFVENADLTALSFQQLKQMETEEGEELPPSFEVESLKNLQAYTGS